ncbi:MAG: M23 family metallopeptidase [Pseudomonadota bacterium]
MHFTVLRKTKYGIRNINLSLMHLSITLGAMFVVVPIVFCVVGYYFGMGERVAMSEVSKDAERWKNKYHDKDEALILANKRHQVKIEQLTARLGALQAQINRINAVGERILELNGIDKNEFDFSSPPPVGGLFIEAKPEQEVANELTTQKLAPTVSLAMMDDLVKVLSSREEQFTLIEDLILDKQIGAESYVSGRPIKKGWMSSGFGKRLDPFHGRPAWHNGVDFAGKDGSPVIATASGVVTWAGDRYGYGGLVEINHGDGMTTRYGHNKEIKVKKGDRVTKGQVIALMGNTGRSTGPHVHYEVLKNGRPVNPVKYIYRKSKSIKVAKKSQ